IHILNQLSELHKREKRSIAESLWKNSNSAFSICE
ncbi:TatD family deoxyribonuclease, partial [Vibrio rotiferianus]